jgi:hypothetical protein
MGTQRPVVVIGAGPAGVAAALVAAAAWPTILLDERSERAERAALDDAGVDYRPETAVWALFEGPVVAMYDAERAVSIDAAAVVIASGGVERVWPVAGWHLPGVVTPSEIEDGDLRYGVIGSGDDVDEATAAIEAAGGTAASVTGDLAAARIEGDGTVERLNDVPVDRVVLALGRRPDPALVLQAGAASAVLREAGITMPLLAPDGATSLPGVFVAGEAAGISGEDAARDHGERAGRAAAAVAAGAAQSTDLRAPAVDLAPLPLPTDPATIVCREQGIDLATVQAAIAAGAHDVNDLRRRTRAGMGLSGGRETMPVLAALLLATDPDIPEERLIARERPPARSLPFRLVIGEERAS